MSTTTYLQSSNPFHYQIARTPLAFYGRQRELKTICEYLLSEEPSCCAIIGESHIGKTSFLRFLTHPEGASTRKELGVEHLTFVYLDASPYIDMVEEEKASVQFWWSLYYASQTRLEQKNPHRQPALRAGGIQKHIDTPYDMKCKLEQLIQDYQSPVIIALDNFQGIASLPIYDSAWLRALAQDNNCAYVVSSRHLLYLSHHRESWGNPSPLWNLFAEPVYLGLFQEEEAMSFILQKGRLEGFWREKDLEFIEQTAGRHPELLRMTCALLYEKRQQTHEDLDPEEYEFLEFRIYRDASPICNQIWHGLADPETMGIARDAQIRKEPLMLSRHQEVLLEIATTGDSVEDHQFLYELEERGLIEHAGEKWQVFAGIMRQFVLRQEQVRQMVGLSTTQPAVKPSSMPGVSSIPSPAMPPRAFTYLEGQLYQYLLAHAGEVRDKEEIKHAIWKDKLPSDSTLQKIIERIRRKIEPDPDNPRYLIAARGQGYILREGP